MLRFGLFLLLLLVGCHDSSFDEAAPTPTWPTATTTLDQLQSLVGDKSLRIERAIVVAGRVTSSDQAGNFYRTLMIEDRGAALEIMAGIDHLHNDYPIGSWVILQLEGATVGRRFGVMQAGAEPEVGSYYPTDYFGSKAALDRHLFRTDKALVTPSPTRCSLATLTPAMAGRLVQFEGLTYEPQADDEQAVWSGYHTFTDATGHKLQSYVRSYADFADRPLPQGRCTLIGILQYDATGDGSYLLKLRDETDCIY